LRWDVCVREWSGAGYVDRGMMKVYAAFMASWFLFERGSSR
jgi:hypothetical protein